MTKKEVCEKFATQWGVDAIRFWVEQFRFFLLITFKRLRILTGHIETVCSLESKLFLICIYSYRTRSKNRDIVEKTSEKHVF